MDCFAVMENVGITKAFVIRCAIASSKVTGHIGLGLHIYFLSGS